MLKRDKTDENVEMDEDWVMDGEREKRGGNRGVSYLERHEENLLLTSVVRFVSLFYRRHCFLGCPRNTFNHMLMFRDQHFALFQWRIPDANGLRSARYFNDMNNSNKNATERRVLKESNGKRRRVATNQVDDERHNLSSSLKATTHIEYEY